MKKMELRQSINDTFYIVFTFSEEETFVHEDYCEEIFNTSEAAEEYAQERVEEDGIFRVVVRCEPLSTVTVPKPVVQVKAINHKAIKK